MEFSKNGTLLETICLVQIKSVDGVADIPSLTTIYHTPSKIQYNQSTNHSENGILVNKTLTLSYPGLSTSDFDKFNSLTRGAFQVYIKTSENNIYEVASEYFFMKPTTSFTMGQGWQLQFKSTSPIAVKYRDNQPTEGINIDGFDYDFDFYVSWYEHSVKTNIPDQNQQPFWSR